MKKISKLLAVLLIISSVTVNSNRASASFDVPLSALSGLVNENTTVSVFLNGATVVGEAVVEQANPLQTFGGLVLGALAGAAIGEAVKMLILNRQEIGEFFGGVFHGLRTASADRDKLKYFLNENVTPASFYRTAEDAQNFLRRAAGPRGTSNLDDGFKYTINNSSYELRKFRPDVDPSGDTWNYNGALSYHRAFMEKAMNYGRASRNFFGTVNSLIDDRVIRMTFANGALYYFVNPDREDEDKFVMKIQIPEWAQEGDVVLAQVVNPQQRRDVVLDMEDLQDDERREIPLRQVIVQEEDGDIEAQFGQGVPLNNRGGLIEEDLGEDTD